MSAHLPRDKKHSASDTKAIKELALIMTHVEDFDDEEVVEWRKRRKSRSFTLQKWGG